MFMNAGLDMSKWVLGGLHHPPLFESSDQFGGQRFVAVTVVNGEPRKQWGDPVHLIW